MIWFFLGFIFGVYIAQESPHFPNMKINFLRFFHFVIDLMNQDKESTRNQRRRSRSE